MPSVDVTTSLFYQYRGFNRESFIRSANLAQQHFKQLQEETDADVELDLRAQTGKVNRHQNNARIPLVSPLLSVPHSLRSPRLTPEKSFTPPLPNYQQFSPASVELSHTSIDIYA